MKRSNHADQLRKFHERHRTVGRTAANLKLAKHLHRGGSISTLFAMEVSLVEAIAVLKERLITTTAGEQAELLKPIRHLLRCVGQLVEGELPREFSSTKGRDGGSALRKDERHLRFWAVMVVEALIGSCGLEAAEARRRVAERLNHYGFRQQRRDRGGNAKAITKETIRNWQADFGGDMPKRTSEEGQAFANHVLTVLIPETFGHLRE